MDAKVQLQEVRDRLAQLDPNNRDHLVEIAKLKSQETELSNQLVQEEASQVRIQVQEEKVESIVLPYDFNEVFADPRANEMIIELIKDLQRQAYAEHNAEVEELIIEHKLEIRLIQDDLKEAEERAQLLADDLSEANRNISDLQQTVMVVSNERDDALSKRDAAVRQSEGLETLLKEKQAHIDKLREEIAIGAKAAINVTNISPSDRLAALVQESKSAKIKSALEIALERTEPIRGKVDVVAPPKAPEEATFPAQASNPANIGLDNESAGQLPAADSEVGFPEVPIARAPEVPDINTTYPVVEGSSSGDGKGQTVEERLSALEAHVFGYVKQAVA